jgi:hypothetical protein
MTIITACHNSVVFVFVNDHLATIVLRPSMMDSDLYPYEAHIFYDGELGEIVQSQNGQTMRFAMRLVRSWARLNLYLEK